MRRLTLTLALALATIGIATTGFAAVTPADLRDTDVVFDTGVQRPDADRARLEEAARDLGSKGFRIKFVVVPEKIDDIDGLARDLRKGVGESAVEAVMVLGPRQLGVDAKVFACEKKLAFDAEVATLRTDDVQGTINVANRLQEFNKAQVLRDNDCNDIGGPTKKADGGVSKGLIGALVGVGLLGAAGFAFARRAAKRGEARRAHDQAGVADTPEDGSGPADTPDDDGSAERETLDP
jgi:hypothetical protein